MRFALAAALIAGVMASGCAGREPWQPRPKGATKDPVCGTIMIEKGERKAEFDKSDYYFCCDECLNRFKAEPTKYVKACRCAQPRGKACQCAHCLGQHVPCDCNEYD